MSEDGNREVAAVQHSRGDRFAETLADVTSANRNIEGAVVTIEVWMPSEHLDEDGKIIRVTRAAFGAAMRGDHVDAAFQRQFQNTRIRELRAYYGHGVFTAGVGQQGQASFCHPFPKARVATVVAVNVVAIGQAFHHHRSFGQAPFQFFQSIGARRMNGNGREEFRMLLRKAKHVLIRDIK